MQFLDKRDPGEALGYYQTRGVKGRGQPGRILTRTEDIT